MNGVYNLSIYDIISKLVNDELVFGDRFESDYGSVFYVGKQDNGFSSNKVLRWSSNDSEVGITSVTSKARYKNLIQYEPITYQKLFIEIKNGSKHIYYVHEGEEIKHLDLDNIDLLFCTTDTRDIKFYIQKFKGCD